MTGDDDRKEVATESLPYALGKQLIPEAQRESTIGQRLAGRNRARGDVDPRRERIDLAEVARDEGEVRFVSVEQRRDRRNGPRMASGGLPGAAPARFANLAAVAASLFSGKWVATTTSPDQAVPQAPSGVGNSENWTIFSASLPKVDYSLCGQQRSPCSAAVSFDAIAIRINNVRGVVVSTIFCPQTRLAVVTATLSRSSFVEGVDTLARGGRRSRNAVPTPCRA